MALRLPDCPNAGGRQKRDHDEFLATSSDPPMFSSDPPIFATSVEDYQQPRPKRQHQRPWYDMEKANKLRMKKDGRNPGLRQVHRRRPFRKFDSGVYMGSNESTASEAFPEPVSAEEALPNTTTLAQMDRVWDSDFEDSSIEAGDASLDTESLPLSGNQLFEKATQTVEDPGKFEGPVFPYWQEQPENLSNFHIAQKLAQEKVLGCVDRGEEVVDLSNSYLLQIRAPTLRPLRFHTRQDPHSTGRPAKYKRLTPALTLLLSNNDLVCTPGELYHLTNLEVLSLRGNNITELLPAISRLKSLKELNLASNQLPYLPYELLNLLRGNLRNITLFPNPFIKPHSSTNLQPSTASRAPDTALIPQETQQPLGHLFSTAPSFLDITGSSLRQSPSTLSLTPSHLTSAHEIATRNVVPPPSSRQKAPSLLELTLRTLSSVPELSQLPFFIPPDDPPHLSALLQRAWILRESGGQNCTICGTPFVVPRTEWVEWWESQGRKAVPFLRRGCSWACFVDDDKEKVGWRGAHEGRMKEGDVTA